MRDRNVLELRKFVSPEFVVGDGAIQLVGRYAINFGVRKGLIVTDPGVENAGWTTRVEDVLSSAGIPYSIFDRLTSNPKTDEVMAGARVYEREGCNLIIAVGGGSPIDCAKAIGIVSSNGGHILDYEGIDEVNLPGPPLICIPTTAGSAADVSQFAMVSDPHAKTKLAIVSKWIVPDLALIDPITTTTMDPGLTVTTGIDVLVHAIEAYVSNASSAPTDMNALEAISLVVNNLPGAFKEPENLAYRNQMMLACLFAGLAFSNAGLGLVHSMAHSLGGLFDLPHGDCNAALLETVVGYNFLSASERYCRIGEVMGINMAAVSPDDRKSALCEGIERFISRVGYHRHLHDFGLTRKDIRGLARLAYRDVCIATNPREPSLSDIEGLYEQAF